jgi:hypothetical protein
MDNLDREIEAYKNLLGEETYRRICQEIITARYALLTNPRRDPERILNALVSEANRRKLMAPISY